MIQSHDRPQGHLILSLSREFHNLGNGSGGPDYEVMDETELLDKNGKSIYEGDIIKETHFDGWFDKTGNTYLGVVKFKSFANSTGLQFAGFVSYPDPEYTDYHGNPIHSDCEVVGNIYEHPEIMDSFYVSKLR